MEAEQIKVIAIGMGYEFAYIKVNNVFILDKFGTPILYKPDTTNNDQMVDIIVKCKMLVDCTNFSDKVGYEEDCNVLKEGSSSEWVSGETINEAVCAAAYEYFNVKGKQE
jgi:hypothetical protein